MTEDQMEMCAEELINEFYAFKISDLTFLFKRIMSGAYGELYESISPAKMLSYFREYFNERCDFAESVSLRSHNDQKSDETFNLTKSVRRIIENNGQHFKK